MLRRRSSVRPKPEPGFSANLHFFPELEPLCLPNVANCIGIWRITAQNRAKFATFELSIMKKLKTFAAILVLLLASVAAGAVINTENLPQTLFELRTELSREYNSRETRGRMMERMDSLQHHKLVDAIKKCNELSLMLYSQNQEYTFDMTYALEEVTREYQDFQRSRMPFDEMQEHLDTEIDKFTRLLASLEQLPVHDSSPAEPSDSLDAIVMQYPFYLDENALEDRDSCIFYVKGILEMYQDTKQRIINDNKYYEEAAERLKESYDYAQERYSLLQKKMFTRNRNNFFQTLASFGFSWRTAVQDASRKYSHYRFDFRFSLQLILNYIWLILALLLSIFARMRGDRLKRCIKVFMPTCLLGLTVIVLRIIFIPNSLLNIIFPPLILAFFLWQFFSFKAYSRSLMLTDRVTSIVGIAVTLTAIVMSWMGYVMLSVLVVIWWLFQLAVIESLTAFSALLERYSRSRLRKKINAYKSDNPFIGDKNVKGQYIRITWWYDLVQMVVIPVIAIVSVPACVLLALDVFDLTEIFRELAVTEFFDLKDTEGNAILNLSAYRIVVVLVLFFLFRYLAYLAKSFYRDIKLRTFRMAKGKRYIHTNDINLTLANNVISILVWGCYAILIVTLLNIPTGTISIIAAGLATGLGLAMRDILNNFIYGIQLMSGRLRVGDWVECDGVRGKVTSISYQSTQIQTIDSAEMSFLNTSLFNKNFKNLTKNNPYELVKIGVGVSYGTDVNRTRELLLEALEQLKIKDEFERDIVDPARGISVVFDGFGDSSVDLMVVQFVLVSQKAAYSSAARELIYNTLNTNGIEIPFPQRDIHIINKTD